MNTLTDHPIASNPPMRHGTCRLTLSIDDTTYVLRPHPSPKPGCRSWILRAISGPRAGCIYSVAVALGDRACSCPDNNRGARCKHLGALAALGLLEPPSAPQARTAALRRHRPELPAAAPPPEDPVYSDPVAAADGFRLAVAARVATLAGRGHGKRP